MRCHWSRWHDLLNTPSPFTRQLLQLLTDVEVGAKEWPPQLLERQVIAIAKPNNFRPIVLLPTTYRCWATLRARQLLKVFAHSDSFHHVKPIKPGCMFKEQLNLLIKGNNKNNTYVGLALTSRKRSIVRRMNLSLVWRLPLTILKPWTSFVAIFTRRFQVLNQVNEAVTSNKYLLTDAL